MKMNRCAFICLCLFLFKISPVEAASATSPDSWPAKSASDITANLFAESSHFEPSDMIWHSGLEKLILVGDGGEVCTMEADGTGVDCLDLGDYSWEGLAIADATDTLVYLGQEYNDSGYATIYEYDVATSSLTGKYWQLGHVLVDAANNHGLESMTFVPNRALPASYSSSSSGGLFYIGSQYNGVVYVYDLDLITSDVDMDDYIDEFTPLAGYTDLAAMFYSPDTDLIYISYDSSDLLVEMKMDETIVNYYTESVVYQGQEAITLVASCPDKTGTFYIGFDQQYEAGPALYQYTDYPIDCSIVDKDDDGVFADVDCSDEDETVLGPTTFYADEDADGLGDPLNSTSDCGSEAPEGYIDNADDTDDTTPFVWSTIEYDDNGIDDDGDGSVDEVNRLSENGLHPTYSTLDPSSTTDYATYVSSVAVAKNGAILVTYVDHSVYYYEVFNSSFPRGVVTTKSVTSRRGTGTLLVTASSGKKVLVNAYTGRVMRGVWLGW